MMSTYAYSLDFTIKYKKLTSLMISTSNDFGLFNYYDIPYMISKYT